MTKSTITRERFEVLANAEYCKSNPGAWLLGLKEVNELARMALAFYEWHDKTAWVQTDKRFDVLTPWGKHRADVLKEYIEYLENRIAMDCHAQQEPDVGVYTELYQLREDIKGPDGFDTWKDAAIAERKARIELEKEFQRVVNIDYLGAMAAFHSNQWHKMGPITGYMHGWNACRAAMLATVPGKLILINEPMSESEDRYLVPENASRKDAYLAGEWNNECNPQED